MPVSLNKGLRKYVMLYVIRNYVRGLEGMYGLVVENIRHKTVQSHIIGIDKVLVPPIEIRSFDEFPSTQNRL